jgi:hypothetical protein
MAWESETGNAYGRPAYPFDFSVTRFPAVGQADRRRCLLRARRGFAQQTSKKFEVTRPKNIQIDSSYTE